MWRSSVSNVGELAIGPVPVYQPGHRMWPHPKRANEQGAQGNAAVGEAIRQDVKFSLRTNAPGIARRSPPSRPATEERDRAWQSGGARRRRNDEAPVGIVRQENGSTKSDRYPILRSGALSSSAADVQVCTTSRAVSKIVRQGHLDGRARRKAGQRLIVEEGHSPGGLAFLFVRDQPERDRRAEHVRRSRNPLTVTSTVRPLQVLRAEPRLRIR